MSEVIKTTEERFLERVQEAITRIEKEGGYPPIDVVGLGPWSASKEKLLTKCPFQFYLKYILKVKPVGEVKKDDPLSAEVGKAAHLILEKVMIGHDINTAYQQAKPESFESSNGVLNEENWESHVIPLEYRIVSFKDRIDTFARMNPIQRVLTEIRIGMTRDRTPTGFFADDVWYRGVIDLVLMLKNGDIVILDHKTGGSAESGIRYYVPQLDRYKGLFHHGMQEVEGAQSGIHFIAAGDVKMGDYSPRKQIETKIMDTVEWELEGAINFVKELGYFKHIRGSACKWCDYDAQGCKSKALLPIELGTKKIFPIKLIS